MLANIDKNQKNEFKQENIININNLFSELQLILFELKKNNTNDLQCLINKYEDINYVNFIIKNNLYDNELNSILLHIQNLYKYKKPDNNTIILIKMYNTFLKVKNIKKYKKTFAYCVLVFFSIISL